MRCLTLLGSFTLFIGCGPAIEVAVDTDAAGSSGGSSTGSIPSSTTGGPTATSPSSTGVDPTVADATGPGGGSSGSSSVGPGSTAESSGSTSTGLPPVDGCGDGVVEPGEQCDGVDVQGLDCETLGIGEGELSCDPILCTFDTSQCVPGGSETGDPDPLMDGDTCTEDAQCLSGHCYIAGVLGGICGECSSDADCEFGCNVPNPLASPPEGSTCSAGNLGENCEAQDACEGALECVEVINIPGIIDISSCSECDASSDCGMMEVCNLALDVGEFDGVWTCVANGSVPLGETCAPGADGDAACLSGFCADTDIMGLLTVDVCSECDGAVGCGAGETCVEPEVGLDGTIVPGMCV